MSQNHDNTSVRRAATMVFVCTTILTIGIPRAAADWPFETNSVGCFESAPFGQLDSAEDRLIRRTDFNGDGPLGLGLHRVPEIIGVRVGNFSPSAPANDIFTGCWSAGGAFVRVEMLVSGVVNPPGQIGLESPLLYEPYLYGPHPIIGFVELDVDSNIDSGGNSPNPSNAYVANVARFGGIPSFQPLHDRVARSGLDLDGQFESSPFVERSGEDFHIALFGDLIQNVIEVVGNGNATFESGEHWIVRGPLFHRSHGYEIFSSAGNSGSYEPIVDIEFRHRVDIDATVVALVYPLTNAASASANSQLAEIYDNDPFNQNSVIEALLDLQNSLNGLLPNSPLVNDPRYSLVAPWDNANAVNFLDASGWRTTALIGMPYASQDFAGAFATWTDVWPSVVPGDFDGDGFVTSSDVAEFDVFLSQSDGQYPIDSDNALNNRVTLSNVGPNFSVYDLTNDGRIDADDRAAITIRGDIDGDFDIDLEDAAMLVDWLLGTTVPGGCPTDSLGACCITMFGGPNTCLETTLYDCVVQGGNFLGTATACSPNGTCNNVILGRCCFSGIVADPPLCAVTTQSDCFQNTAPISWTANADCNGDPCTTSDRGACCLPPNPASPPGNCVFVSMNDCEAVGGAYQGDGSDCLQNGNCGNLTFGRCCYDDAGTGTPACEVLPEAQCYQSHLVISWTPGADCVGDPCQSSDNGACCFAPQGTNISVCTITSSANCLSQGGTYLGPASTCVQLGMLCGAGFVAQSITIEQFIDVLLGQTGDQGLILLADLNGDQYADGRDIQPFVNSFISGESSLAGACCFEDNGGVYCAQIAGGYCVALSGTFRGLGTNCNEPCAAPAADIEFGCCVPGGGCTNLTPIDCSAAGGVSDQDALSCDERSRRVVLPRADINYDGLLDGRDIQAFANNIVGP